MNFGDGTAEARVQARYAQFGTRQELGRAMQDVEREHYVINGGLRYDVPRVVTHIRRATDRAIQYLVDLNAERFPNITEAAVREWAQGVDRDLVSEKIDWLKTQPKQLNSGTGTQAYAHIPVGYYAVTGDRGQSVFLRVTRPESGPFAGRVFVNVQAGDELHQVSPAVRNGLLAKIEGAGVRESSTRYGREIGSCGVCHRTLTDADSRSAGIGPVCRGKMGW